MEEHEKDRVLSRAVNVNFFNLHNAYMYLFLFNVS